MTKLSTPPSLPATTERLHIGRPNGCDPGLGASPQLAYYRKSSEDEAKQTLSIEQQRKQVAQAVPGGAVYAEWWESKSGTTFVEREAFKALRGFCEANPQPRDRPGHIWAWDYDRFSREQYLRKGKKTSDVEAIQAELLGFARIGWAWQFVNTPSTGNMVADLVVGAVKGDAAGQFSATMSATVTRGKAHCIDEYGSWVGGAAPYPAMRVEIRTGRPLRRGEWAQPGCRVTLARDPALYPTWERAAKLMLDEGLSANDIAAQLNAERAPLGTGMVDWRAHSVKRMLTNPTLVARPVYLPGTDRTRAFTPAWEPLVDVGLWERIAKLVAKRKRPSTPKRYDSPKPLRLTCPKCDGVFHHRRTGSGRRVYSHPLVGNGTGSLEWRQRSEAARCRAIVVDAATAEDLVIGLVVKERLSPQYVASIRAQYELQHRLSDNADQREATAKRAFDTAKRDYERANRILMETDDVDHERDLRELATEKRVLMGTAKANWERSRQHTESVEHEWEALEQRVSESRQIAATWKTNNLRGRANVFEQWVEEIYVGTTPLAPPSGHRRPDRFKGSVAGKTLTVFLKTRPEEYETVVVPAMYGKGQLTVAHTDSLKADAKSHLAQGWKLVVPSRYGRLTAIVAASG